jgi:hypothetical protein
MEVAQVQKQQQQQQQPQQEQQQRGLNQFTLLPTFPTGRTNLMGRNPRTTMLHLIEAQIHRDPVVPTITWHHEHSALFAGETTSEIMPLGPIPNVLSYSLRPCL